MRVYLPATLPIVRALHATGELRAPLTAFAVTPALRESYASGDAEELEYAAFANAARAALRLLDADPTALPRRVVISADLDDRAITPLSHLDPAAVRVGAAVSLDQVAAVHVDDAVAEQDVRAAADAILVAELGSDDAQFTVDSAEGHELQWYAVQELGALIDSL